MAAEAGNDTPRQRSFRDVEALSHRAADERLRYGNADQQFIELSKRLFTEIPEFQQVVLIEFNKVTQGFNLSCLQTVQGTNGKIQVNQFGF